jgi:hypothetical protein
MVLLEKCKNGFHLDEIELNGPIVIKRIFKFKWKELKWIDLYQDGNSGFAFVNMVMNIFFFSKGERSL